MKEIAVKQWSELQAIWNDLIDENPIATPFQSYEFLSFTGKGKAQRKDLLRTIGLKELNVVLYDDYVPIAIAPMLVKTKMGKTTVYFRGHFTTANQLDFIYTALDYDDFQFLMDGIRKMLGNVSFFLDRVYCKSPTSDYLKWYLSSAEIQEHECFAIPIPTKYDTWYESLHKSVRRNYTTTRNRIAKDDIQCETSFLVGEKENSAVYKEMMLVYADRYLIKNRFHFGPLQNSIKKILQLFLLRDKMSQWLNNTGDNFQVVVTMNSQIAAFASGLICKDKRILCNRFAINTAFGRYRPGAILLSDTVDYLAQHRAANNAAVKLWDMGQGGGEGSSYKVTFGGEVYYNYSFKE